MGAGEIGGRARGSESGSAPGAGPRSRGGVEHSGNLLVTPPPLPPTEKGRADAEAPGLGGGGGGEGGKEGGGGRGRGPGEIPRVSAAPAGLRDGAQAAPHEHVHPRVLAPRGAPHGDPRPPPPPPPPPLPPRRSSQFVFTLGKAGVAVEGRRRGVGGGYSREAEAAAAAGSICCPSGRWRAKSSWRPARCRSMPATLQSAVLTGGSTRTCTARGRTL